MRESRDGDTVFQRPLGWWRELLSVFAELCLQGLPPVRISITGKDFSQDEECSACVKIPLCPLHECLPICEMNLRGKDQIKEGLH